MVVLETRTWSISLHALTDMHVCAPSGSSWDPAHEFGTTYTPRFFVESGSVIVLRPDDVVQIGELILKIQRDSSQPEGEMDDVQVKSSGHTGVIIDTEDEEQQKTKNVKMNLPSNSNQTLSTPNVQSDGMIVRMEAVMETPAASRHQDVTVKASPVLSCIDEIASGEKGDSQAKKEMQSDSRVVVESFDDGTISVDGSAVPTPRIQNLDSLPNNVLIDPIDIFSDPNAEIREKLTTRLDQMKEDSQMSTFTPAGQSLPTPLESQERASGPPAPHIDKHQSLEASNGTSVQLPPEPTLSDPYLVSKPSSKSVKRKWPNEEGEGHATKTISHVEIPTNEPVTAYKMPSKKRRLDPAMISPSNMPDLTRGSASRSPRGSDESSPLARSTRSSLHDPNTPHPSTGSGMKIMFARSSSSVNQSGGTLMKFLRSKGVSTVKSVKDCDVLCVGSGQLKKTSNLVLAVLGGKKIINDDWAQDSFDRGQLQDLDDYLATDPEREAEWGINLSEAIERGKKNVKPFMNHVVCFTDGARKELGSKYDELKEIALLAGARAVRLGCHRISKDDRRQYQVIIIASQIAEDPDLYDLKKQEKEEGLRGYYSKDIITQSALRGTLDPESDEFVIHNSIQNANSKILPKKKKMTTRMAMTNDRKSM